MRKSIVETSKGKFVVCRGDLAALNMSFVFTNQTLSDGVPYSRTNSKIPEKLLEETVSSDR